MKLFKLSHHHSYRLVLLGAMTTMLSMKVHSQNLLPNPEFENVSSDKISGWEVRGENQGPLVATDSEYPKGKTSVHLKVPGAKQELLIKTEKPVSGIIPGKSYRLTFFARSPVPNQTIASSFYTAPTKAGHWRKTNNFILNENWTKYSVVNRIPTEPEWANKPLVIRFVINSGEIFLDDVSLEENKDEGTASPNASRKNLLDNPGFELGWLGWGAPPSGYLEHQPYQETETPSAIDTQVKYEGNASLRIEPKMRMVSRPYPVEVGQPYTVSFYARAVPSSPGDEHIVKFYLTTANWKPMTDLKLELGKNLSSEWKRYSFKIVCTDQGSTFKNAIYFRIQNHHLTTWIDAVQLEQGDKPTEYQSDIQAGLLTDSPTGIFTQGKPAPVQLTLYNYSGLDKPMTVSVEARDAYSNVLWKREETFAPSREKVLTKPLELDTSRLGVMNIQLKVKSSDGTVISQNDLRYMITDGKTARQNPLFGTENLTGQSRWLETMSEDIANIGGSGFTRCRTAGFADSPLTTSLIHERYERKKKSGKIVVFEIDRSKASYRLGPNAPDFSEATIHKDIETYVEYGKKIGREFKDVVDIYQIFNEVNLWNAYPTGKPKVKGVMPPDLYIKFVAAISDAIRSVNPDAKITTNINAVDMGYTEALFKLGVAKYINVYSIHTYRGSAENPPLYEDIKRLRALIDKYAPGMPIINDEQYYGVRTYAARHDEADLHYYADSEEDHAGRILQTFLHLIAADKIPWSIFAVDKTLYRHGMSNPFYYYYGFGGFRFMSQTLYDLENTGAIDVHPSARSFYFKRKDGTIIVSINSKTLELKGGIRDSGADEAFDCNGNPLDVKDAHFTVLPTFLFYKGKTVEEVSKGVQKADIYGLDAPIRVAFEIQGQNLVATLENCESRPLNADFTILNLPQAWPVPQPFKLSNLEPRGKKSLNIPLPPFTIEWNKDYTINYRVVAGNQILNKSQRLPSIFAPRKSVVVDGNLDDWNGIPALSLGEENLSIDFSNGKYPHQGPGDLSAKTSISWDEQNVYCSVMVNDDVFHVSNTGLGKSRDSVGKVRLFESDSLQFYFDMHNDASRDYDDNDTTFQVGLTEDGTPVAYLDHAPGGRYIGDANETQGIDDKVQVKFKKLEKGYQFEIAFSKEALPYLDLKAGSQFGFSLLVNDNDGQGRKQGVFIGPKLKSPNIHPNQWRTVKLTE